MSSKDSTKRIVRYAQMFAALGSEPRLQILRLLLSAHPDGMVVGDIQAELGVTPSTLSHHLEKLRMYGLVQFRREGTYLWYRADTDALRDLISFLYAECCSRTRAVNGGEVLELLAHGKSKPGTRTP